MIFFTEADASNVKTINPLVCRLTVWTAGSLVDSSW